MGRFHLVWLFVAGCGRLGFDQAEPSMGVNAGFATPAVCGTQQWTSIVAPVDSDLSVAATPTGAALFAVATSGGPLLGFAVDTDGNLTTGLNTVRAGGPFTASAAAYVDNTLIAAAVSASRTLVHIVPMTVDAYTEIANVDGERVASNALLHANADRITPTACGGGLTVNPFDNAWNPTTSQLSVTSAQTVSIAASPLGGVALVAFSTASTCYIERLDSLATGTGSSKAFACKAPRLANDGASTASQLVFEAADGIHLADIADDQLAATSRVLAAGSSPRIVWDGSRYWVSYLDPTGAIAVGTFALDGSLVTTTLAGTAPTHDAYELAMVGGTPWVYSVDAAGFSAQRLCLVAN